MALDTRRPASYGPGTNYPPQLQPYLYAIIETIEVSISSEPRVYGTLLQDLTRQGCYVQDERYAAGAGMRTTAGMQEVEQRRSSCRGAACVSFAQGLKKVPCGLGALMEKHSSGVMIKNS